MQFYKLKLKIALHLQAYKKKSKNNISRTAQKLLNMRREQILRSINISIRKI